MSDPVTNVEIEDVLSSIRRLVSDEARTPPRSGVEKGSSAGGRSDFSVVESQSEARDQRDTDASHDAASDRPSPARPALILTPALRVSDGPDDSSEPAPTQAAKPAEPLILTPDPDQGTTTLHYQETVTTVLEWVDEGVEPPLAEEVSEPVEATEDVTDQGSEQTSETTLTIEDKIAALETLIGKDDGFELDGDERGANAPPFGASLPWDEESEDLDATGFDSAVFDAHSDPDAPSQDSAFDSAGLTFRRARSEAVQAASEQIAEDVTQTLRASTDPHTTAIDEDTLRDMVAEIVRQELQGPLGERITRNVRKLVRREIYRAIAANELD